MPSRSRQRQLAKQAARRQAERRRQRRQRWLAIGIAIAVALGGIGFAAAAILANNGSPSSSATPPTPTPSYNAGTGKQTGTVTPQGSIPNKVACGGSVPKDADAPKPQFDGPPPLTIDTSKTYTVTMQTSCGDIAIELDASSAPFTANSIVFLAQHQFFDGIWFHRIVPGFVIQGGDPLGTGTGGPGYKTVDDPGAGAQYPVGTVAMAKASSEANGTSGSQFFIVTDASAQQALAPGGVGQYAIVGHVTKGLNVVQKIAAVPVGGPSGDTPQQAVYIEKVTISVSK